MCRTQRRGCGQGRRGLALKKVRDELRAYLRTADATLGGLQREYGTLEKEPRPASPSAWRQRKRATDTKTLTTTEGVRKHLAKSMAEARAALRPPPPPPSSSTSTPPPAGGSDSLADQQAAQAFAEATTAASQQSGTVHDLLMSLIQSMR